MRGRGAAFSIVVGTSIIACTSVFAAECKPLEILISVPLRPEGGVPVLPVTIGGVEKKLVLSTEAPFSEISQPAIQELKLNTLKAAASVIDNGGHKSDRYVILPSLQIGQAKADAMKFMVRPAPGPMNPRDAEVVGVLAPDILENYDVDIDFVGRKLQLVSNDHCDGKVVYWQADKVAVVPMTLTERKIFVNVVLDGKPLRAVINTAAPIGNVNQDIAEDKFGFDPKSPDARQVGMINGDPNRKVYRKQFQTLAFEGVTIANPELNIVPDELRARLVNKNNRTGSLVRGDARLPDVTIGMSILRRMHVYIAYRERKVYLTEAAGAAAQPPADAQPVQ